MIDGTSVTVVAPLEVKPSHQLPTPKEKLPRENARAPSMQVLYLFQASLIGGGSVPEPEFNQDVQTSPRV